MTHEPVVLSDMRSHGSITRPRPPIATYAFLMGPTIVIGMDAVLLTEIDKFGLDTVLRWAVIVAVPARRPVISPACSRAFETSALAGAEDAQVTPWVRS